MKKIKTATLAIMMTTAAISAWGMDYRVAAAKQLAPLLPFAASAYLPFISAGLRAMTTKSLVEDGFMSFFFTVEKHEKTKKPNGCLVPCTKEDIPAIKEILRSAFKVSHDIIEEHILFYTADGYPVRVWKENNIVKGVLFYSIESTTNIFIHSFAVSPNAQRKGIGSAMLNAFEKEMASKSPSKSCKLTLDSAPSALGFYKKYGFTCNASNFCTRKCISTMND